MPLHFSVTSPSATIWATARRLISQKVLGRHMMSDSLKGPGNIPFLKACTIISSSLVCSLTTCAPNQLRKSFNDSLWYCLTSKRSLETGGGSRLTMYCSLNSIENCAKNVTCLSGRLTNQSSFVPVSMLMDSLQCTASEPPDNIIWVWKVVI